MLLAAIIPLSRAQTHSDCKDNLPSCAPNKALSVPTLNTKFGSGGTPPPGWMQSVCKGKTSYDANGVGFTVASSGDCPSIETDSYVLFGMFEVKMKAAPGQGIVSSIVMESDALDEVDWEFIGGENFRVQSNYFGKGDTTTYDRMVYVPIADPQNQWHTYGVNWTSAAITWLVDGAPVRTLNYADAKGGTRFPQTPMKLKVGIWAGGDPSNNGAGTVTWAGGNVDYAKGPFSMYVDSINIVNYSPAQTYKYKDNSGTWQSIDVIGGSEGGIESPSQVAAQQSSVTSSIFSASTGSPVPVQPLSDVSGEGGNATLVTSVKNDSTIVAVSTASGTASGTGSTTGKATIAPSATYGSSASASKTSSAAKATTNAATAFGSTASAVKGSALLAFLMAIFT